EAERVPPPPRRDLGDADIVATHASAVAAHYASGPASSNPIAVSSRAINSFCPGRILARACAGENHSARSTSGNFALRPLRGGHSNSNPLDCSAATSKSPSSAHAATLLRLG